MLLGALVVPTLKSILPLTLLLTSPSFPTSPPLSLSYLLTLLLPCFLQSEPIPQFPFVPSFPIPLTVSSIPMVSVFLTKSIFSKHHRPAPSCALDPGSSRLKPPLCYHAQPLPLTPKTGLHNSLSPSFLTQERPLPSV